MSLIKDMRGGRDNDPDFGSRMRGMGPMAELIRRRFNIACKRLNLNDQMRSIQQPTNLFRPPLPEGLQMDCSSPLH